MWVCVCARACVCMCVYVVCACLMSINSMNCMQVLIGNEQSTEKHQEIAQAGMLDAVVDMQAKLAPTLQGHAHSFPVHIGF